MVAAYSSAQCIIYDLETAAPVVSFDSAKTYSKLIVCFSSTTSLWLVQHSPMLEGLKFISHELGSKCPNW